MTTGAVTDVSLAYDYGGPNCGVVDTKFGGTLKTPARVTNGRFKVSAFGGADVFEGRFNSPTEASGTGRFEPQAQDKPGCETAEITWRARH